MHSGPKKELIIAAVLLGFGLIALPYSVYLVGSLIIGPYEGDGGAFGLMFAIWSALGRLEWGAWLLVLSPYLIVQLVRLIARFGRARTRVTTVTD